jgi:RNA recognition motif-containing protein
MKLYVGNMPYSASEADLENWLTENGIATDTVSLVRDRYSGESRGFGFVEIGNQGEGETAIQNCHGRDFLGRTLVVREARSKIPPMSAGAPLESEQRVRGAGGRKDSRRPPR